ncbi:helix-turn-helix transcriptional regulator [Allostreptomyces psammosilenae]|uniref:DNA-binding CsgD family transcriptional regulator n=1 Tax=Allostreptomyces psammosilenae TaxID=1892865 RepID=A0A852ZWZ5_9ACTN|nr:helix-turn-helix domain-containing protein [Allostreptomyces psammosilenae]NYI06886.1 DNA-binding CsgD family transcriptional regulator [Allostreptomyces psammosilenae]
MLQALGISGPAEGAYRALLRLHSATAAAVAREVGLGTAAARRALGELTEAGLAEYQPGRRSWQPVDPRLAVTALVRLRRQGLALAELAAARLATEYDDGVARIRPSGPAEALSGREEIAARLRELLAGAEKEILVIDAPPYVAAEDSLRFGEAALARGVSCRTLYTAEGLALPGAVEEVRRMAALGERARVLDAAPVKLIVVDGARALLPLSAASWATLPDAAEEGPRPAAGPGGAAAPAASGASAASGTPEGPGAVLVRPSRITDALVALFESLWRQAVPLSPDEPARGSTLDSTGERELRDLAMLLAAGLKDEAIARQLRISQRTLHRRLARLLAELGASSRFQAGIQAVRRGWVRD